MGFHLPKGAEEDLVAQNDINITPFIDVMLVLLIIFMVAAPLSTVDTLVSLPQGAGAPAERPPERIMVSLALDGAVQVDGISVPRSALTARLADLAAQHAATPVYLSADQGVSYGDLMGLMAQLSKAQFREIGLVGLERLSDTP
jgi:biopolymer transport protein ExbD